MGRWFKRNFFRVSIQVANNNMKKRLSIISYWGNENLNHKKTKELYIPIRMAKIKETGTQMHSVKWKKLGKTE